jgi:hypothetical protein
MSKRNVHTFGFAGVRIGDDIKGQRAVESGGVACSLRRALDPDKRKTRNHVHDRRGEPTGPNGAELKHIA